MTFRSALVVAAAALTGLAVPAFGQGYDPGPPPPLPAWDEELDAYPDDEYADREESWEEEREAHPGPLHHGPAHAMGYPEQRAAWLEQCGAHAGGRLDECEAYLLRHEQSYRGHGQHHGYAAGAYGYHYPYPYPVMWVKVPIVTERRDCSCETVVEEWVEEEPAPPRVRRAAPRPDKRIRTVK